MSESTHETVRAGDLGAGDQYRGIVVVRVLPTTPRTVRRWWGRTAEIAQVEVRGIGIGITRERDWDATRTLDADELVQAVRYRDEDHPS